MDEHSNKNLQTGKTRPTGRLVMFVAILIAVVISIINFLNADPNSPKAHNDAANSNSISNQVWRSPNESTIPKTDKGNQIRYGCELIAHTARYFGPNGSIAQISNGMNCQNCHLDAGSRPFGNNYFSFVAAYPKVSNRSGKLTQITARIAECFERSLGGKVPDTSGREVKAILAYMSWLGTGVTKGQKVAGSATEKLPYLDRAADANKGRVIFTKQCQSCHGANGEGLLEADKRSYKYPPLWGQHSYTDGAGMYRLANFAGFVKNNMPYGANYKKPQLTDEEAWDVAAFVNSQPRPHRDQRNDWQNLKVKPIDLPFGPYLDTFGEKQHKLGPFKPIVAAHKH